MFNSRNKNLFLFLFFFASTKAPLYCCIVAKRGFKEKEEKPKSVHESDTSFWVSADLP